MALTISMAVLVERVENLTHKLEEKHQQNRKDIHKMQNDIQALTNQIWLIKIKLAGFAAAGAGGAVGVAELIKWLVHIWK
jgi:hypothetical protein